VPGGWARGFGQTREQDWNTKIAGLSFFQLDPKFDGNEWGVQTGLDLVGLDHENGARDRFGAFYTHAKANGDTFGFTLGQPTISLAISISRATALAPITRISGQATGT
jgi:hypothetical protein